MLLISKYNYNEFNAGPKAKIDIENILNEYEKIRLKTLKINSRMLKNSIKKLIIYFKEFIFVLKIGKKNEDKIVQFPFRKIDLFLSKKCKNTFIIHDIEGLRQNNPKLLSQEINQYKIADYVIVHNSKMQKYLIENGINQNKIKILELFDYLVQEDNKTKKVEIFEEPVIIYAGNLTDSKCPFIYQIEKDKINFKFNLYGVGITQNINEKMKYKGSYSPDVLPDKLEGNLGLVWDGNYDESDENEGFKNYTKYNNPHKLSCYIAAGLPVIVWRKAAVADFVKKYNIGYTIGNIYDINNIDFSDYEEKLKNVQELSEKVRSGYFTKKVINEILADIGEK